MEMEPGKLFIGGISWDTNEDRMREYFQTFGEVVEAVIMKDRTTGRARGFGFIVFADPSVAERVVRDKHIIDGRTVEAKKAVPRDDQNILNRNSSSNHRSPSPSPIRTKKIFVGGLASTVTESDFKNYFDQFGTITDVVVMYDHQTQRPRGFGFITFDSEESVEKVLHKTFHELNGKMVEVKRAVPKELSPGPTRAQLTGYSYGPSRVSSLLNAYTQGGYNSNSVGGYGVRMDGRYSPVNVGRSGYSLFSPSGYGMGLGSEPGLGQSYQGNGYGGGLNGFLSGNPNRYNGSSGGIGSVSGSTNRNLWGNESLSYATNLANSSEFMGSGNGNSGLVSALDNIGEIWGSSRISGLGGGTYAGYSSFGSGDSSFQSGGGGGYGGNRSSDGGGDFGNFYGGGGGGSLYADPTWRSSSLELDGSGSFGYRVGNASTDGITKNSAGYVGGYSVTHRSNGGIAA